MSERDEPRQNTTDQCGGNVGATVHVICTVRAGSTIKHLEPWHLLVTHPDEKPYIVNILSGKKEPLR